MTALHTRENPIGFEELHDILQDYETYLTRDDMAPPITSSHPAYKDKPKFTKHGHPPKISMISLKHQPISIIPEDCHLKDYDNPGHIDKVCYKLHYYTLSHPNRHPTANHAHYASSHIDPNWTIDPLGHSPYQ